MKNDLKKISASTRQKSVFLNIILYNNKKYNY